MKKVLLTLFVFIVFALKLSAQTTYYWVGGNGVAGSGATIGTPISWGASSWNTLADGTGSSRTVSAGNDILIFDGNSPKLTSGNKNIYLANIPRDSCGQLQIINGAIVTCVTVAGINQAATGYTTTGSANVTLTAGNVGYAVGMPIAGTGIPSNTTISSVGTIVNVSSNAATTTSGSAIVTLNVGSTSIVPGMTITGTGIPTNTVVTATTTPTIITATGATSTSTSVTLTAVNPAIVVGMGINGSGIPAGTTITAYDGVFAVTLSAATTTTVAAAALTISTQQTLTLSAAATATSTPPAGVAVTTTGQVITLSQVATATSAAATPTALTINADLGMLGTIAAPVAYGGSTAQLVGTGTSFTNTLQQGDFIIAGATFAAKQIAEVLSVNNATDITISNDAPTAITAGSYWRATTLYIKGNPGLTIDATSTLNMSNTWGSGGNPFVTGLVICLKPGATGNVFGKVGWGYGSTACRLVAMSPNALAFKSGSNADLTGASVATAGSITIYPFGSALGSGQATASPVTPLTSFVYSTLAPGVTFEAGSNYKGSNTYKVTGSPFGIGATGYVAPLVYSPAVSFQPNSNYYHTSSTTALAIAPWFIQNNVKASYGNLIFNTSILPCTSSAGTTFQLNAAHIDTLTLTSANAAAVGANTGTMNIYKGIIVNNPSLALTALGNVIFQGPSVPFVNATTPVSFTTSQFYAGLNNISTTSTPVTFGSATFSGTATQNIGSTLAIAPATTFSKFTVQDGANVTLGMNIKEDGALSVSGNLDLGTYTVDGTASGSSFVVNGVANKTYNAITGSSSSICTITAGSTAINVSGISQIPIGSKVTCVNNPAYIPANTYVISYSSAGNYVISNAATATASGGNGIDSASLALNFALGNGNVSTANTGGLNTALNGFTTYNAAYTNFGTPAGSYTFNAVTTTPFHTGFASPVAANNLTVAANTTLNKAIINLSGTLNLASGILTIPTGDSLRINSGNAILGSPFSNAKFIDTKVDAGTGALGVLDIENFSTSRLYPVGTNGNYLPVTIVPDSISGFAVTAFNGATQNGLPNGTALTAPQKDTSVDASYIVSRVFPNNANTHTATLTLGYPSSLKGTSFAALTNKIGISHYNGTTWDAVTGSGNNTSNTATASFTSFSPFLVTKNANAVAVPVKFGSINASIVNQKEVKVSWTIYTEINADRYIVERSYDGINFTELGTVKANNSSAYNFIDIAPQSGVNYYRTASVDKGTTVKQFSAVVAINLKNSTAALTVYPNPVKGKQLHFQVGNLTQGTVTVALYNTVGQKVYGSSINYAGGILAQTAQLPSFLMFGNYELVVTDGTTTLKQKVLVLQ